MTRWINPSPVEVPASFADLNLHPLVAQTLIRRGIITPDSARAFLNPLHSPSTPATALPGMDSAVERISSALRARESICIWGDFDVDGQTSTALLVETLQALGANVTYYIPIRGKESHGVHIETLKPIIENGANLIITCDTGITAHKEVEYAKSCGVDFVITDHHDFSRDKRSQSANLPNAIAVVNPKLLPEDHPLANLAGVGVAYKLAEELITRHPSHITPNSLLDLVALGLVADVALLKGETRSLVQKGIQVLRHMNRLGLRVMAELSGTSLETITEETIGFTFAPRLNALGRLGDANPAVELLISNNPARARVLATQIEGLNAQRRLLTSQVYEAAETQLRENPELLNEPAIILAHPNWPGGVVGIVANRLVDRYHKPALLFNESDDGILRGSARSVEGLHITEAIAANQHLLLGFGGHPMAAGLALPKEKLPYFRQGLGEAVEHQLGKVVREEPTLQIDAWIGFNEINLELAALLESMSPFGAGNPSLVLATRTVQLRAVSTIGRAKEHIRLNVEDNNGNTQSILWWGGAGEKLPEEGSKFDIAYSLRASSYRGENRITLQFEDFRIVEEAPVELNPEQLDIRDYRRESASLLGKLQEQDPGLQIWAEGSEKSKGKTRFDLHPAEEFAIYTTPPSPAELHNALETVKPKIIYIFAVAPAEEKIEDFLNRLAGLSKYTLNQRGGKATIQEFAVAMAARENAIQIGLQWLAAGGHLSVNVEDSQVNLSAVDGGSSNKNQYLQTELYVALKGILNETAAYRKYFATINNPKSLFDF